jgi:hypothetical protein
VEYWDAVAQTWTPLSSQVDSVHHRVSAQTSHFSLYQPLIPASAAAAIAAAASNSVATAEIACNPLRPNCQPMAFQNLPADARLRIYTVTGALVKDIYTNSNGRASWDGTNQNGSPVASGVYLIFAQGAGTSKTLKVGVQR